MHQYHHGKCTTIRMTQVFVHSHFISAVSGVVIFPCSLTVEVEREGINKNKTIKQKQHRLFFLSKYWEKNALKNCSEEWPWSFETVSKSSIFLMGLFARLWVEAIRWNNSMHMFWTEPMASRGYLVLLVHFFLIWQMKQHFGCKESDTTIMYMYFNSKGGF